jgi:hypothetical protein
LCAVPSAPTSVIITSSDALVSPTFNVYPNPASNWLHVSVSHPLRYELFDCTGRLLQSGMLKNRLDVSAFDNGFYILRLGESERLFYHPFVVER